MKRCILLLSGASPLPEKSISDMIICADSGAISLVDSGIIPDHIIGDMDSIPVELLLKFERSGSMIHRFPQDKDRSDGELGVHLALEQKPDEILIYGGKDGRADHILSSFHLLHLIPEGVASSLFLEDDRVLLIREGEEMKLMSSNSTISVLPACKECIISLTGLKWELDRQHLKMGSTLGIHNESTGSPIMIKVERGSIYLMIMNGA